MFGGIQTIGCHPIFSSQSCCQKPAGSLNEAASGNEMPSHLAKSGILKSMATREAFLCKTDKSVVFHYTPKHASWMNQIEIRFGILTKKAIKCGNFSSEEALKEKLLAFIDYFNATMAKPFRWTHQGKPLLA